MKVNRVELRREIENIIADGVMEGEEVDVTANNIMEVIEGLIKVAELYAPASPEERKSDTCCCDTVLVCPLHCDAIKMSS